MSCVLEDERMSGQGMAGAQRQRAHLSVGSGKQLSVVGVARGDVMGDEVGRNSKGLGGCGGARNLDFILQGKPWREEGVGP